MACTTSLAYVTAAPTPSAFAVPISTVAVNAWNALPLTNPSNINTTGTTYLRLAVSGRALHPV